MAYYPTGKWYRSFIEKYEENAFNKFKNDLMQGITEANNLDYKKHYNDMLASGMFFEWNPSLSGDWEVDMVRWIEKYGHAVEAEQLNVTEPMSDHAEELKEIQLKLEEIINALKNAIERGNDLHLGIVVGQTLKQLEEIAYG